VTWSRTRSEAGCLAGVVVGLVGGMLVSFPLVAVLPENWAWLAFLPFVVLPVWGAVRGRVNRRAEVVTAKLGSSRIVMENAFGTREADVAELTAVDIRHRGNKETVLSLAFEERPGETIPGRYDPELATALRRLFGPAVEVRERHEESPSTG
jgi:hypothetical protein